MRTAIQLCWTALTNGYVTGFLRGKLYAGPVWDQDMTLGTGWTKYLDPGITDYHYLAKALIRIPDIPMV